MTKRKKHTNAIALAVGAVLTGVWWFWASDWIEKPQTYRLPILLLALITVSSVFHVKALIRFHKMTKRIREEEKIGQAPEGSTLFAANQRFRYAMRVLEAVLLVIIAVVLVYGVSNPEALMNKHYGRLVITYFLGTIALTGYLTVRDLIVIDIVRKLSNEDEAFIKGKEKRSD